LNLGFDTQKKNEKNENDSSVRMETLKCEKALSSTITICCSNCK